MHLHAGWDGNSNSFITTAWTHLHTDTSFRNDACNAGWNAAMIVWTHVKLLRAHDVCNCFRLVQWKKLPMFVCLNMATVTTNMCRYVSFTSRRWHNMGKDENENWFLNKQGPFTLTEPITGNLRWHYANLHRLPVSKTYMTHLWVQMLLVMQAQFCVLLFRNVSECNFRSKTAISI